MYDSAVIGGGPAGIGAALNIARHGFSCVLLTKLTGGKLLEISAIENWPGKQNSGSEIVKECTEQIVRSPLLYTKQESAMMVTMESRPRARTPIFIVKSDTDSEIQARTLVLAMGNRYRKLGLSNENRLEGKGVSYCATCDVPYFKNKVVVVIGGDKALATANRLSTIAKQTYLLRTNDSNEPDVAVSGITKLDNSRPTGILGEDRVRGLQYIDVFSDKKREIAVEGIFIEAGHVPAVDIVRHLVETDDKDQIIVDHHTMATSMPGVFAAGDITNSLYKQAAIAAGDGTKAGLSVVDYLLQSNQAKEK